MPPVRFCYRPCSQSGLTQCPSAASQVLMFLQLTDFVNEDETQDHAPPASANEALRNRPGPTPATVKPIYHNTGSLRKLPGTRTLAPSPPHLPLLHTCRAPLPNPLPACACLFTLMRPCSSRRS